MRRFVIVNNTKHIEFCRVRLEWLFMYSINGLRQIIHKNRNSRLLVKVSETCHLNKLSISMILFLKTKIIFKAIHAFEYRILVIS
jgi:hypothetical protein